MSLAVGLAYSSWRETTHRDPIGENPPIVDGDDISMVPCFQAPPMVKNLRIFPSEQQNA